jgi:hypothetical protein
LIIFNPSLCEITCISVFCDSCFIF